MITVKRFNCNMLSENCYVVSDDATGRALIVDPGSSPELILQAIEKANKEYEVFRVRQDKEYMSEFDKQMEKYFKGE